MKAMQASLRGFFMALLVLCIVLSIAAYVYSQDQNIPGWVTTAVLPAFLIEAGLYLGSGIPAVRARLEGVPKARLAVAMTLSAVLPYVWYSTSTGMFQLSHLAVLGGLRLYPRFGT